MKHITKENWDQQVINSDKPVLVDLMTKLVCRDYGFECNFVARSEDASKVIEEFGKHTLQEHGIDYSKEALMHFHYRKNPPS